MHRVRVTKYPSFRQIDRMVSNLKAKFGPNANIQTITGAETKFWINNDSGFAGWLDKWSDLQVVYFEVMKRKNLIDKPV